MSNLPQFATMSPQQLADVSPALRAALQRRLEHAGRNRNNFNSFISSGK
ncbi:hypothetical protein [Nocardia australiensis]|nr:hypothetical protein [Nocardia australiensis]